MNIWSEGIDMEKIRSNGYKINNKSEDFSLDKSQEELQDTTAGSRRYDFWDTPIERIASTAEGATQTDLEGKQLNDGRVSGKDK